MTSRSSISRFPAEVDRHYNVDVGLQADIGHSLDALAGALDCHFENRQRTCKSASSWPTSWPGTSDDEFPMAPARVVADTRAAMRRDDIVLVDTGTSKMWMARLYRTYTPNTCLISNGLSTMAWTLPGAIGAKVANRTPESSSPPVTAGFS